MNNHLVTTLSILLCGVLLLLAGALIPHDALVTIGTTVMVTGLAYGTGKAIVRNSDETK